MKFFEELKRRNVFRVGIAYVISAWVLLQFVDLVLGNIQAPPWVMKVFMLALAVGFPLALFFAWAFEVTPEGIKKEKDVDRSTSIAANTGQKLNRWIILLLLIAVGYIGWDKLTDTGSVSDSPETPDKIKSTTAEDLNQPPVLSPEKANLQVEKSIAVLPFRDMSAAQDQAYFGEGIAEELLNALVKLDGLQVASRTSAFSLADEDLDIPAIAERLGVSTVLEGSVRTSGQQVRVTAQLIDVSKDIHLWSETYNGSLSDIFKIQDEITGKIIEAMKVHLGGNTLVSASTELTDNAEAYQLYLQGRQLWRQRSTESLYEAIGLFKQALKLDPNFHRAWSNLAIAYDNIPSYDSKADLGAYNKLAENAANQALKINPQNSEALTVMADMAFLQCDKISAVQLVEKAIASNPNDPTSHHWYAMYLSSSGNLEQALKEIRIAHQIDPLISAVIAVEAEILRAMGNYKKSADLFNQATALGFEGGSLYESTLTQALNGDYSGLKNLSLGNRIQRRKLYKLFADAIQDPAKTPALELYISQQAKPGYYVSSEYTELLIALGSPFAIKYLEGDDCVDIPVLTWVESFKEVRGTAEFFHLMERQGTVDFWREFGWPDDCASLDQSLAECH